MIEAVQKIHSKGADNLKLIAFGHDRGARLAYRMALDAPGLVIGIAVLDIVPTPFMWARMSLGEQRHDETRKSHHWVSLFCVMGLKRKLKARCNSGLSSVSCSTARDVDLGTSRVLFQLYD